jgi:hypothetical protein
MHPNERSKTQIDRIEAFVAQNWPGHVVVWDNAPVENTLRFYVETRDHVRVIETSGNITLDEFEKRTDDQLHDLLVTLSAGKL